MLEWSEKRKPSNTRAKYEKRPTRALSHNDIMKTYEIILIFQRVFILSFFVFVLVFYLFFIAAIRRQRQRWLRRRDRLCMFAYFECNQYVMNTRTAFDIIKTMLVEHATYKIVSAGMHTGKQMRAVFRDGNSTLFQIVVGNRTMVKPYNDSPMGSQLQSRA